MWYCRRRWCGYWCRKACYLERCRGNVELQTLMTQQQRRMCSASRGVDIACICKIIAIARSYSKIDHNGRPPTMYGYGAFS